MDRRDFLKRAGVAVGMTAVRSLGAAAQEVSLIVDSPRNHPGRLHAVAPSAALLLRGASTGRAAIYPGFTADLSNQPYFLVRTIGAESQSTK
ncbi:MAG: hypothetical protein DMG04_04800 [Acidobacteria bacterium]|nr:MAG: hypothetical protein DMG04_04800 [Acidobacteriota bacterium]PYQ84306.1 MAG: hypothetical protein DMG02_31590 [Acidobacteriota bacterium]PYR06204.1 MAG: hypothetical protein DMF99_26520 [Acidobacteriota bacterium]